MVSMDGISRWRSIGDLLINEIETGVFASESRLPRAQALAERFGVNRHTVLRALAHLQALGFVRKERGRGTHVVVNPIEYRIGPRHWFEQNILELSRTPWRRVLSVIEMEATLPIAKALEIAPGDQVVRVELMGEADRTPINFNRHYFPAARLPGIADSFRRVGPQRTTNLSFSAIFRELGITDWRRRSIKIRARGPSPAEIGLLKMANGEYVLETEVISVEASGRPLVFATTSFCASRVELSLDLDKNGAT